jgi:hypothetical protein
LIDFSNFKGWPIFLIEKIVLKLLESNILKVILGIKYIKLFLELNILKIMIGIK